MRVCLRPLLVAAFLSLVCGASGAPAGAAVDPALAGVPARMLAALKADDAAAWRAACAPDAIVTDEFAPYVWTGTDACVHWAAGFAAMGKQIKMTALKGSVEPKPFTDAAGNRAYLAARVTVTAKVDGKPFSEAGTWTFVFAREAGAWKIISLAWGTLHH